MGHRRTEATLGLAAVLILTAAGCGKTAANADKTSDDPAPKTGATKSAAKTGKTGESSAASKTATKIELTAVDPAGFEKAVAAKKGQVVVVDFWATWCVPCRKAFPHTVAWAKLKDVAVVTVAMEFDPSASDKAVKFLTDQKAQALTNLISKLPADDETAYAKFGITSGALPHYRVYGKDGKLVKQFELDPDKPTTHDDVEAVIKQALGK